MLTAAVLSSLLLNVPDPSGDHNGNGTYDLPENLTSSELGSLDLRAFTVLDNKGTLQFGVVLGALTNTLNAPRGFSTAVVDIFIKTRTGGNTTLGETGFETPPHQGWQYHLQVSGFKQSFERVPGRIPEKLNSEDIKVSTSGTTINIQTPIPAGKYQYWVTVSLFDPLTPTGLVVPTNDDNPFHLTSRLNDPPVPIDVLASGEQGKAYAQRTLSPVGDLQDYRPWVLLTLGLLGVVGGVTATLVLMNIKTRKGRS